MGNENEPIHDSDENTVGLEDGEIYEPGGPPVQGVTNVRVLSDETDTQKRHVPVESTAKGLIKGYRNMGEKVVWPQLKLAPK